MGKPLLRKSVLNSRGAGVIQAHMRVANNRSSVQASSDGFGLGSELIAEGLDAEVAVQHAHIGLGGGVLREELEGGRERGVRRGCAEKV